jgi:hypothetical protein
MDADLDVDADDVALFIGCFTGPGGQATPTCIQ